LFILVYSVLGELKWAPIALSAAVVIAFGVSFGPAYKDINVSYHQMRTQYQLIYKAEATKDKSARGPLMTMQKSQYNANYGVIALDTPANALMNQWEAKFFGLNQITGYRIK